MKLAIDLSPEHLQEVRAILTRHIPGREVWVFGSRAKGTAKPTSDLDLCVLGHEPLTMRVYGPMRIAFEDSVLPMKVDIVEWATIAPEFRRIIEGSHAIIVPAVKGGECAR